MADTCKSCFFVYPTNRAKIKNDVHNGLSADNALYGLNHLDSEHFEVLFQDVSEIVERILDILFAPLSMIFLSQIGTDFKLGRILLQLLRLNKADIIITNIDSVGLPVCFLKGLGLIKPPIIYAVGLFFINGEVTKSLDNNQKSLFLSLYKWILSKADHVIYHAPIEKEKLEKLGLYDSLRCTFIPVGSDAEFFKTAIKKIESRRRRKNLVVAVGRDRGRDYKTLFECAQKLHKVNFVVICSQRNIEGLSIPANVKVIFDLPYKKIRDWYRQATVVVIPMAEIHRSSGQMTLTDTFQTKSCVVISDVIGIAHYPLKHNHNVVKVEPGNSIELFKAINRLLRNEELQENLRKNISPLARVYTTQNYTVELEKVIDWVIDPVKLKYLSRDDLDYVRQLRNQYRNYFLSSDYLSRKDEKKWFSDYLKKTNDNMFILTDDNSRVGVCAIYNIDHQKHEAEVGRFMTEGQYQRMGFGKKMIEKLEFFASRGLGLKKLILEVLSDNQKAIGLYHKSGFKYLKKRKIKGKEVVFMSKLI